MLEISRAVWLLSTEYKIPLKYLPVPLAAFWKKDVTATNRDESYKDQRFFIDIKCGQYKNPT